MIEQPMAIPEFKSGIGSVIREFLSIKMALGYKYTEGARMLRCFDQFLWENGLKKRALPEQLVKAWTSRRNHESAGTHRARFRLICQLARFMLNHGYDAYCPNDYLEPLAPAQTNFTPHIFTHEEIKRFLRTVDELKPAYNSPLRHLVMPELFRVLYGCGLRVGEVLRLTMADADLEQGVLTIRQSKFRKDRLVPLSPGLHFRLMQLCEKLDQQHPASSFFPSQGRRPYTRGGIYQVFRQLLNRSGIVHRGTGNGPRVHDLRHTFAVHRLQEWYEEGIDLASKLPVLAAYMGHRNFYCTQRYMHLTLELSTVLSDQLEQEYGWMVPRRENR